uniref:Retrotransposon protein, putative, Ty1-copia subclass n=1 Tax=Tanacetum cinerariifolium TaxID=118510 RepID=A0A6L2L2M1_TANCI|nr:hypothetical protein [Tanacetum cinerariifolium]
MMLIPVVPLGQQVPLAAAAAHAACVKGQKEELKAMFSKQAEQELLQTVREFHACKQEEVSLILVSLNKDYDNFVQNYNMHGMRKTVNELHAMLKLHEDTLPKKDANPALHAIRAGKVQKIQKNKPHKAAKGGYGKGKSKMGYAPNNVPFAPKPKTPPPPKKDNPAKDSTCHQCGEIGHWRRNCPVYLAEFMKKKKLSQEASTLGIFTIEIYSFPSKYWIYDIGCGTHICITTQGLRGSKKLKPGALSLYVGDGHRAAVEAIGTYHLELPSELVIVLNNFHYAPSITRGVISVSRLFDDGFINRFDENIVISVSKNNLVYFMAVPRYSIFEIDMYYSNTNDSSIKKHIEKLQHDRLLNSIDIESLGKCVSCMSEKMARKPYSHQVERAKYLLGLIHTDVCGLFRIMSRQGANYFVTFTDGFSHYGYVYLLKHKHEVFEIFKVFQKKVENQLGKTIKSLRSDRGGEYMSQEFLDHLKKHEIISHRTPPYTPQHNGVSERRNRTLLDMVRSMMSQTTLRKSFWDYALKTVARILNMIPTKKRDTLTKPDKLDPRSFRCIFVGYPKKTMEYYFYSPSENKVFVARNAEFFENDLIDLKASGHVEDLELIQEEDTNPSLDTSLDHEEDDQEINEPQSDINPIRKDLGEPANYKAALLDPESKKWLDAMNVEMQSMKDNDVWVLVELSPNARTIGSKWLFKKKTDMDGAVYVFKARLVAKGFTQTYEVDCEETFTPVADIIAIRILIAIAAYYDYEIWQMDVKTVFLNGHLPEEVYMEQPEGFVNPKYYMENSKRGMIPMQEKLKLSKSQGASTPAEKQRMQNVPYASAIGLIMYAVRCTRSDVALAQNITSRFQQNPGEEHWTAVKNILKYLRNTKDMFSVYGDAEYIAAFDASKEAVWIHKFISGLGIVFTIEEPISMYCDNIETIAIAKDDGDTKGARHFRAKVHYLRETIKLGDVKIEKVDTDDNLADPFTKALAFFKHYELTRNIEMLLAAGMLVDVQVKGLESRARMVGDL